MNWLWSRIRRQSEHRQVAEEMRAHVEERVDELVERGMEREAARTRAILEFGNANSICEEIYEAKSLWLLDTLWQDLRIAVRSLTRRPGFAIGIVITLGLGLGATTTAFTVVDGVVMRPLPYSAPSNLATVGWIASGAEFVDGAAGVQNLIPIWDPTFLMVRERTRSFVQLAGITLYESTFGTGENGLPPEKIRAVDVTSGLFEVLDAKPVVGRMFLADEYQQAIPRVAMISYPSWQRRFGGDPRVLDRPWRAGADSFRIVGVLSPDFRAPEAFMPAAESPELWTPVRLERRDGEMRRVRDVWALGRLAPGISVGQARTEMKKIAADLAAEFPSRNVQRGVARRIGVNDLHAQTIGATGRTLKLFMGAASLLLLLAGLNATTMLLVRSLDRTGEFATRLALGAGRVRLVRLLLSESGILAVVGGALGVMLAYIGVGLLLVYNPFPIPRLDSVAVDARTLTVATVVSLGAGIMAGLVPALRLTRLNLSERVYGSRMTPRDAPSHWRSVLVGGQVAVAVVLLSAAGLFSTSYARLRTSDPGFDSRQRIQVNVEIKGASGWDFQAHWNSWDELRAQLRSVPGVESVALTSNVPFETPKWTPRILMPDDPSNTERPNIAGYVITPGYFNVMGTELLAGRDFGVADRPGSPRVAIVNETFVRTMLGGADAVGAMLRWSPGTEWAVGDEWVPPGEWLTGQTIPLRIVGIVEDVVQSSLGDGPRPAIYVPYTQSRPISPSAAIRSALPMEAIVPALRAAIARFNPRNPGALKIAPMASIETATLRFQAMLIGAFASVAILLAASGLYASMLHFVGRRRRDVGVRIALGASRSMVLGSVFRQGMLVSMGGLACGMAATMLFPRLLTGVLFEVEPNDPTTLLLASVVLMFVSAAACLVPAYQATTVDTVRVLKDQ